MGDLFSNALKFGQVFLLVGSINGQEQVIDIATNKEDAIQKSKRLTEQGKKIERVLYTKTSEIALGANWLTI